MRHCLYSLILASAFLFSSGRLYAQMDVDTIFYGNSLRKITSLFGNPLEREFVWGKYIEFIVSSKLKGKDVYGDGTENSTGMRICELGESWAYANERLLYAKKFTYKGVGRSNWFEPSISSCFSLMNTETLSMADIYYCLSKDVLSIDDLKQKLLMTYPDKSEQINEILR